MKYLLFIVFFWASFSYAYQFKEPLGTHFNQEKYYSEQRAPKITIRKSDKDCSGECRYTIDLGNGRGYETRAGSVEELASARYGSKAFSYVRVRYKCKDGKRCNEHTMYSTSSSPVSFSGPNCSKAIDRHVNYSGELMCLYHDKLTFHSGSANRRVDLPAKAIIWYRSY